MDQTELKKEFEERLAESGDAGFRVARGVLRNGADAEDVAQEPSCKLSAVGAS